MAILCFDYGHGGEDPGSVYKGRKEKADNLEIGKLVASEVRRHGITVDETRTSDKTVSLKARSDFEKKKKYDFFISFHRNAFEPEKARGVETYTYLKGSPKAKSLARKIQKSLVDVVFVDRGVKTANFHVLRETRSPATLIEIGFIDNTLDNEIFVKKKEKIVKAITIAILEELNIKYKEENEGKEDLLYRVIAGAFKDKENAQKRVKALKSAGFDAYIKVEK
ncbi:N-acetylmuramoyl-L-alanine amidase [Tissierella creatinophila]|uniref:Sporulation-specific N-acetylmuramoyl-L-alanine amidase n=1 Tax=Tissierella creatinophila DSM 6911 TaxID=1123403 RepID=A0A1U7M5X3_TISCR|nr:N-acetylmuramoyl-L-alanine amidase [Tissierella creatinophila]OLS02619.1 sporulation-specific N-acetylmuramoyl-L-alanine amidase [Tissierella creatinophila DSM 6911]